MRDRLEYLDGLRGIAASAVLFQHSLWTLADNTGAKIFAPLGMIDFGRLGVLLFFLISGYVIPPTVEKPAFVKRRALRLLPALWASIAIYVLLDLAEGTMPDPLTIAANMGMVAVVVGVPMLAGFYWTLTYELGFYAFCLVLARFGQLRNVRLIGIVALVCAAVGAVNSELYAFPAYLLTGMIWREANGGNPLAKLWGAALLVVLIGVGLAQWPASSQSYLWTMAKPMGMILPILLFLAALRFKPATPAPLLFLGAISYSLYLMQDVPLRLLAPYAGIFGWTFPVIVFAACVGISALSYRYIEQPFLKRPRAKAVAA